MDTLQGVQYDIENLTALITDSAALITVAVGAVGTAVVTIASALARIFPNIEWLNRIALNPKKEVSKDASKG